MRQKNGYKELELCDVRRAFTTKVPSYREGVDLPTGMMIECADGKTRRVYARCKGNAPSLFVRYKDCGFVVCEAVLQELLRRE